MNVVKIILLVGALVFAILVIFGQTILGLTIVKELALGVAFTALAVVT